jgi:hypothetical protein
MDDGYMPGFLWSNEGWEPPNTPPSKKQIKRLAEQETRRQQQIYKEKRENEAMLQHDAIELPREVARKQQELIEEQRLEALIE